MRSGPVQGGRGLSRRRRLEPAMQSHTDGIRKEFPAENGKWSKTHRTGLHFLEMTAGKEAVDFSRIMPLRLKSWRWRPRADQLQQALRGRSQRHEQRARHRIQDSIQTRIVIGCH